MMGEKWKEERGKGKILLVNINGRISNCYKKIFLQKQRWVKITQKFSRLIVSFFILSQNDKKHVTNGI